MSDYGAWPIRIIVGLATCYFRPESMVDAQALMSVVAYFERRD